MYKGPDYHPATVGSCVFVWGKKARWLKRDSSIDHVPFVYIYTALH